MDTTGQVFHSTGVPLSYKGMRSGGTYHLTLSEHWPSNLPVDLIPFLISTDIVWPSYGSNSGFEEFEKQKHSYLAKD